MEHPSGNLEKFPDGWKDPLELYGIRREELISSGHNLDTERSDLKELIEKYGAKWVWDNRHRLISAAKCLNNFPRK